MKRKTLCLHLLAPLAFVFIASLLMVVVISFFLSPVAQPVHAGIFDPPAPIPTLSEWGIIALVVAALTILVVSMRRKRKKTIEI